MTVANDQVIIEVIGNNLMTFASILVQSFKILEAVARERAFRVFARGGIRLANIVATLVNVWKTQKHQRAMVSIKCRPENKSILKQSERRQSINQITFFEYNQTSTFAYNLFD